MSKRYAIFLTALFCGFLAVFFAANLISPDRDFSEDENRYLAQKPELDAGDFALKLPLDESGDFFTGKFMSDFETYLTDQFVFRDEWIAAKAMAERLAGKGENNGVYLCDQDTLIPRFDRPDATKVTNNLDYVNKLVENVDVPVYFSLIPGKVPVLTDRLPEGAPNASEVKVIDRHVEKAKHNLKGAPIVIAGGYGMGSKEGFDKLFELAKELHAEVGASRAAVDAGYADHDRQIGQTGVTVRPKLYIACGISGQIQHIAGMQDAGIIISVNSDPNAPINTIADYVINGTVEEVVPKLIKYYKKNSK